MSKRLLRRKFKSPPSQRFSEKMKQPVIAALISSLSTCPKANQTRLDENCSLLKEIGSLISLFLFLRNVKFAFDSAMAH